MNPHTVTIDGAAYSAHKIDGTFYLPRNTPVAVGQIIEWSGVRFEALSVSATPRSAEVITREAT